MTTYRLIAGVACAAGLALGPAAPLRASQLPPQAVIVQPGRPLRVVLDRRTRITRVGQPVIATLVEAVYSYDRVVIPEGTKVWGHVATLEATPAVIRAAAILGGNFTPDRLIGLQFDTLVLNEGVTVPIQTVVTPGSAPAYREVAGAHDDGIVGHVRQQVALEARRAVSSVKGPGRLERFGHFLLDRLPVHPQFLDAGTAFDASIVQPISLGTAERAAPAPAGTPPPPDSILAARLLTPLDSATTSRGTAVTAVLTRPLLSAAHDLILPEGTVMTGKVTFVKSASRFRRNGQLRFLFEKMEVPGGSAEPVAASLYSADVGRDQHLIIDEEGGARVTNPKSRFVAPALASAAMILAVDNTELGDEGMGGLTTQPSVLGRGLKGLSGFGLLGVGLSLVSRPAAIAFGSVGLARAVYVNLLGKGHDVVFPVNTPMQIQLSPGALPARP